MNYECTKPLHITFSQAVDTFWVTPICSMEQNVIEFLFHGTKRVKVTCKFHEIMGTSIFLSHSHCTFFGITITVSEQWTDRL